MPKICTCGCAADAMERATQFICKMIDDNECDHFVAAVCFSFGEIGNIVASNSVEDAMKEGNAVKAYGYHLKHTKTLEVVRKELQNPRYLEAMNERVKAAMARDKAEHDLPKDDVKRLGPKQ